MPRSASLSVIFSLLAAILVAGVRCLKNVRLELDPRVVEHGQTTSLRCYYELEGVPLYTLKWYRDSQEFYRYSPGEKPPIKIFAEPWIEIDVGQSNKSQVTIRNVSFHSIGNYSCEVTTDFPTISTATSSQLLDVVVPPPVIMLEQKEHKPGDKLTANCSSKISTPPAHLSFTLNGVQISNGLTNGGGTKTNTSWSHRQWIEIQLDIPPFHYRPKGELTLRCTAIIPGIHRQSSEIQLRPEIVRPTFARGTTAQMSLGCHGPHHIATSALIPLLMYLLYSL